MSKLTWKTLGLAALVAGGLQMATMGGATALTLPAPASPGVDTTGQWDGQLHKVYTKKKSYQNKQYRSNQYRSNRYRGNQYRSKQYRSKQYRNKSYRSGKRRYYYKRYPNWRYNSRRYGPRYRAYRPGYGYYYGGYWYRRPWWTFTVPVPAPAPVPAYGNAHVRWCLNHYRSYNPRTDMFLGYDGYYHRCRSPY